MWPLCPTHCVHTWHRRSLAYPSFLLPYTRRHPPSHPPLLAPAAKPQFEETTPNQKGWAARINFVLVYLKDRLFLMGGKLGNGTYANDIWSTGFFQDGQNPWDFDGSALWSGREGHQAVVHTVNGEVRGARVVRCDHTPHHITCAHACTACDRVHPSAVCLRHWRSGARPRVHERCVPLVWRRLLAGGDQGGAVAGAVGVWVRTSVCCTRRRCDSGYIPDTSAPPSFPLSSGW